MQDDVLNKYNDIKEKFDAIPNMIKCPLYRNIEISLLAPYKCKIAFNNNEVGLFGYGSLNIAKDVHSFGDSETSGYSVNIGNYCEDAAQVAILLGGEHKNNRIINYTFSVHPDLVKMARDTGVNIDKNFSESRGPVVIGSNVTLSSKSLILSGVTIGNGAVIGANSVVTKDIPAFAIAAGSPAKVIRMRFDDKTIEALEKIRWWDMQPQAILKYFDTINKIPDPAALETLQEIAEKAYIKPNNNLMVLSCVRDAATGNAIPQFIGVEIDGKFIKHSDLPDTFKFFIEQIKNNKPGDIFYMVKDIFKLSGLTS